MSALAALLVSGCYDVHGTTDVDVPSVDASRLDARVDAPVARDGGADATTDAAFDAASPDADASIEPCGTPRAQIGVCRRAIGLEARLDLPFGNRGLWATVQEDRLVQLVYGALGAGFGVLSLRADLGEVRAETDLPATALREDGVDFEVLSHLGPADSRCTHWLAEFATRDGSARRSLVFDAGALPSAPFRTGGSLSDGATTVASRGTPDGRLLALSQVGNDLVACASDPAGYVLFMDEVALDGAPTRLATIARDGRAPLAAVARNGGFVLVDRSCADGALAVVHITDDGLPRVVPITIVADGVARSPLVPSEGAIGALLSRRSTSSGLELSVERFDVETGAAVGERQAWASDAILAHQTLLAVDIEGNVFWPVTLAEGTSGSSDWLVSYPVASSAPTPLHVLDRGTAIDGATRLRWWDGRLVVDTRTDVGFSLIEVVCGD